MKSIALFSLLFAFLCSPLLAQGASETSPLDFKELPPLPDPEGFAGMYAGVSRGALLLAGGANFPEKRGWEGGQKVWYDHIFVLENPGGTWRAQAVTLPQPMAYGASVTYGDDVILLAVNVFAGCSFADTPDTGVSFTAVTLGDGQHAAAQLERLQTGRFDIDSSATSSSRALKASSPSCIPTRPPGGAVRLYSSNRRTISVRGRRATQRGY